MPLTRCDRCHIPLHYTAVRCVCGGLVETADGLDIPNFCRLTPEERAEGRKASVKRPGAQQPRQLVKEDKP